MLLASAMANLFINGYYTSILLAKTLASKFI